LALKQNTIMRVSLEFIISVLQSEQMMASKWVIYALCNSGNLCSKQIGGWLVFDVSNSVTTEFSIIIFMIWRFRPFKNGKSLFLHGDDAVETRGVIYESGILELRRYGLTPGQPI
jgi:hypothetical protein